MKTLRQLNEELQSKRSAFDAKENEFRTAGDLTEAQETELNGFLDEIETLKRQIATAQRVESEKQSRALAGNPINTGLSEGDKRNLKDFSIVRGLQLMTQGKALDGIEAEIHQEAVRSAPVGVHIEGFGVPAFIGERRDMTVTGGSNGSQGGATVATEVNGLIEALWSESFLSRVGARRLAGLKGNQSFPVQSTKPTTQALTEIEAITASAITFTQVAMAPTRRGSSVPFSKQLLLQSSIDVESFILDNLRLGLDYQLNVDAYDALAASVTGSYLLAIGTDGGAPTYDHIVQLEGMVDALDANSGSLAYLTNSKVKSKLKRTQKFSSTNGEAVWGADNMMNGYNAVASNIIPSNLTKGSASAVCSPIFYGDFNHLFVGMWGGADFVVDGFTKASTGEVVITTNMFWDVAVARAASFAGIKDATTT